MDNNNVVELEFSIEKELYDEFQKLGDYLFYWDDKKEQKFEVEDLIKSALESYIDNILRSGPQIADWLIGKANDKKYTLKNRLKKVLKKKDKSQVWLSEKTGLPRSTVSQILSNNHEVSLRHFLLIWKTLDCPPLEKVLYFDEE
ncbi:helix-turn-helix transcriptional regulator [Bacillus sp. 31A1R]|uniref:Helix-turn-helix transcriptional regulator n=1 Tax=Robertmurraya mangrovi TaxID=3098077 RepID=A0ABU5IZS9_9BACI|nr:helix-turn-helix transcriptional regulator [Bacillus sp. 31A1R]MDZ5472679.1 helix-turn-helix transcriptional regulator [Bacillus sp. 31A1R]